MRFLRVRRRFTRLFLGLPTPLLARMAPKPLPQAEGQIMDPAFAILIAYVARRQTTTFERLSPAVSRANFAREMSLLRSSPRQMRRVTEHLVPGATRSIPLRLYAPENVAKPASLLVYYHGGGGVVGDLDSFDSVCRFLADEANCLVASVDYCLAPEHPFPAAIHEAVEAYRWVVGHAEELGATPDRIGVGGDSFGSNLAANVSRELAGSPDAPCCQLLFCPMLDSTRTSPSHRTFGDDYGVRRALLEWATKNYLPDPSLASTPRASPLFADDLAGLPPTLIATAGFDPLRDEGRRYAERLRSAGVTVRHHCYTGFVHGFLTLVDVHPGVARAVRECASVLADMLAAGKPGGRAPGTQSGQGDRLAH